MKVSNNFEILNLYSIIEEFNFLEVIKELENIPVGAENLASNLKVQALTEADRQVTVVVKGSEDAIKDISANDITAYVDLSNYGVGEHEVEVKVTGTDLKLSYGSKTKKIKVRII